MKKMLFSIFWMLLIVTTFCLPYTSAQDYARWGLPEGAIARLGKGNIEDMEYSPDGTKFAVATSIGIWIYDAKTLEEISLIAGHTTLYPGIKIVSFSPDGETLIGIKGSFEGIKLWDVTNGTVKKTLMGKFLFGNHTVLLSPDGQTLASDHNKEIYLWDTVTGKHRVLRGHPESVNRFAFSPDGLTLASGSKDQTIRLWDVATGEHKQTLTGHSAPVTKITFSPDGSTFVSVSDDKTIYLWDTTTGKRIKTLANQGVITNQLGDQEIIERVFFSPDGGTFATVRFNNTIRLWDTTTGELTQTLTSQDTDVKQADSQEKIQDVLFSPDKRTVVSITGRDKIRLWDIATGKHKQLADRTLYLKSVCLSADGKTLATADIDHTIRFWDTSTGKQKKSITSFFYNAMTHFRRDPGGFLLSPNGSKVVSMSFNNTIHLCDTNTGKFKVLTAHTHKSKYRFLESVLFSPDGATLLNMSSDGTIRLWDTKTGKHKHTLANQHSPKDEISYSTVNSIMAFSPDSRTLANVGIDNTIRLWSTATGTLKRTVKGHTKEITAISFSPDGKTFVSGSQDGTLRMWDVGTGKHKQTITNRRATNDQKVPPIPVSTVSFSLNGVTLASGHQDGSIYLWDVATDKLQGTFIGHTDAISKVSFSPDGLTFASASMDGSIRLWDIATGQRKQAIAGLKETYWHVFFYPDGLVLASESKRDFGNIGNENVHIWDLKTGQLKKRLVGHSRNVSKVFFSADGQTLVSGSPDGTALVWDIASIIKAIDFSE